MTSGPADSSDSTGEIYIDGSQVSTSLDSDDVTTIDDMPTDEGVSMFALRVENSGYDGYLDATLDNVIFGDDILSSSEVQDDYGQQPWS